MEITADLIQAFYCNFSNFFIILESNNLLLTPTKVVFDIRVYDLLRNKTNNFKYLKDCVQVAYTLLKRTIFFEFKEDNIPDGHFLIRIIVKGEISVTSSL